MRLLFEDTKINAVISDPNPNNLRAIRVYEKVGFKQIRTVKTPDGPALLMVIKRSFLKDNLSSSASKKV